MNKKTATKSKVQIVSAFRENDGVIGELIYDSANAETAFLTCAKGETKRYRDWRSDDGTLLKPVSGDNNLLRHRAVFLPEKAEAFGNIPALVANIGAYVDRYVDLSPDFRVIAIHYVLLTWVYDAFNELPYLRFRGEPGSGKTRALIVLGSICYQAFLASGASTVSPIFHTLDLFRGTFVFDEADFRFSDEKMELVKILNNGNVRGFPVFRSVLSPQKQFDPRAFHVFGPKMVAMRHAYQDRALESRFLTEEMGQRPHRLDIPINLPDSQKNEARALRNKLLAYRFQMLRHTTPQAVLCDPKLSSRMNQILVPLLSVTADSQDRATICRYAERIEAKERGARSVLPEALLLGVLLELADEAPETARTVLEVTERFRLRHECDFERPITARYIGSLLRTRLHLTAYKTGGVFVLPPTEWPKIEALSARYGVELAQPAKQEG